MKFLILLATLVVAVYSAAFDQRLDVLATECDPVKCQPPNCRCSSTQLSPNIEVSKIPQIVLLTFDDAVTALNYEYITDAINGRKNPDGCPAAATFYTSHEYTDYSKVHLLWSQGHEIALHSITHTPFTTYWKGASVDLLVKEFGDQRKMMAHFAQIDINDITGMRLPLFQISGNNTYEALVQSGLKYDSSWPTQHFVAPGMWPYSLDYASTQDCIIGPCPTASIPQAWVAPLLTWQDSEGYACAMVDACGYVPDDDATLIFEWMKGNFLRVYNSNRAPFGVYLHSAWFLKGEHYFEAYKMFLDYMNSLPDVYFQSTNRAIEYTRNPQPLGSGKSPFGPCQKTSAPACVSRMCQLRKEGLKNEERWMTACTPCPAVYPWIDNVYGDQTKSY